MSIFNLLRQRQNSEAQTNIGRYYDFLASINGEPTEAQVKELHKLLDKLGRRIDDAEKDAQKIAEVRQHIAYVKANAKADEKYIAANEKHIQACEARQKVTAQVNEAVRVANNDKDAAADVVQRVRELTRKLSEIQASEPYLWAALNRQA